jgi:hypothetical protein
MNKLFAGSAAAALLALVASGAHAATVVGAKSIVITNAIGTWLQVAEVDAETFSSVDVALQSNGGVATAQSVYQPAGAPYPTPGHANDGDFSQVYPDIYHSNSTDASEFLKITLLTPQTLSSLSVYGRAGCGGCDGRDVYNFTIYDGGGVYITSGQLNAANELHRDTITFERPTGSVPEPASWALMILGFGGVGYTLRRRTATASLTA